MKINNCTKLVCNVQDKEIYPVHILALKQALNHGLKLTKVHRAVELSFEQMHFQRFNDNGNEKGRSQNE